VQLLGCKVRQLFCRDNGGVIKVGASAMRTMRQFKQTGPTNVDEAGGVLLGRMILESNDVVVDEVTIPTRRDKRGIFSFFRSAFETNTIIKRAWRESAATRNYLGEWHTHPEDYPTPSNVDISNWRKILRKGRIEQDFVLFMILGRKELAVWEWNKRATSAQRLHCVKHDHGHDEEEEDEK
jgi:integrative and conjugative element protein (TIGR02256 family)